MVYAMIIRRTFPCDKVPLTFTSFTWFIDDVSYMLYRLKIFLIVAKVLFFFLLTSCFLIKLFKFGELIFEKTDGISMGTYYALNLSTCFCFDLKQKLYRICSKTKIILQREATILINDVNVSDCIS